VHGVSDNMKGVVVVMFRWQAQLKVGQPLFTAVHIVGDDANNHEKVRCRHILVAWSDGPYPSRFSHRVSAVPMME